jgi:PAS domain S-box-containing protein
MAGNEAKILSLTRTQRFGLALLGVILAALLRLALNPVLGEDLPLFLFVFPIVVAAWFGGLWPGLLATALSLLIGGYLFIPPRGEIFNFEDALNVHRIFAFAVTGTLVSILCEQTRKAIKSRLECLERFGILVDSVSDYAIVTTDPPGRITCWNKGTERITGYKESDIVGHPLSIFEPEDAAPDQLSKELEIATTTGRCEHERWQKRKDGSRFWASGIISVLRNESGELRGFAYVMRDMTERKMAEESNRFIMDLNQALFPLADPAQMIAVALRMVVEHLGVDRAAYADMEADEDHFMVIGEYIQGATPSMIGRYRLSDFGRGVQALREGRPYVVNDVEAELHEETDLSFFRGRGIRSVLCVPLTKGRQFVSAMAVHQNTPRLWRSKEIDLVTTVANRCWESVERASVLKQLKDSDDRYRAFIANSSEGIWRYELDEPIPATLPEDDQLRMFYKGGYIAECNEVFALTHGYAGVDQILGWRAEGMPLQVEPDRIQALARAFVCGGYRLTGAEAREIDIHGDKKTFVSNLIGIQENGKLCRVWGTQRDITEQKRAEDALRESEELFAKAFHASPDALSISRMSDGVIFEVNDSFIKLFGYSRDELIGKSTLQLDVFVDPSARSNALKVLREKGHVSDMEFELKRKSGEHVLAQFSAEAVDLHGEHCWIAIGRDITERKRAEKERDDLLLKEKAAREEAESANRLKDEFLATMSHELRTPLTSILGWARLLTSGSLPEPQMRHAFEVIQRSAESQTQLIDDILDTSRIITGRFNLDIRPIEIGQILQAAVAVVRPSADVKGIIMDVRTDAPGSTIFGDTGRVRQIFWNLLSNAVKFTDKGGRIEVRLTRVEDRIEVSISDTGIGIDPYFLPNVFDRFRQADSSSTRRFGGLGLGLAIVRHLAELHGGSASASSRGVGLGSTFKVDFPAAPTPSPLQRENVAPEAKSKPTEERQGGDFGELKGISVLVVEDDPETRDLLKLILVQCHADVTTAGSAAEALRALEHSPVNVLLSDLAMPDQDGYDLIRCIRSTPEPERSIPAVALSAYTRTEDRTRALAAGFDLHLPKPIDPAELVAALARLAGLKN